MPEIEGFRNIGTRDFGSDTCFLCRCELTDDIRTVEHVIPKWVLTKFNLWNESLTLLNGTEIPYRQLTIPCCFQCNNRHLKPLEDLVSKAVLGGLQAVENLDKEVLFLWLGKIFFGMVYKELLIPVNRRQPEMGNIVTPDHLKRFFTHHVFLQAARFRFEWMGYFPASIFVYEVKKADEPRERFNLQDNYSAMSIAIRLDDIAILAAMQDGEVMKYGFDDAFDKYRPLVLHSVQLAELTARLFYKVHLMENSPFYTIAETDDRFTVIQHGFYPRFGEWENKEFALLFMRLSGMPLEKVYSDPLMITYIDDEHENPKPWKD